MFNFRLTELEQIEPWGRDNDLVLHWFALTYGCYWIRVGEAELFRYREEVLEGHRYDFYQCEPYVDYPIVRLWEDLLEILPSVMIPVPQALAEKLDAPNYDAWRTRVERWMESADDGLDNPDYEYATEWVRKRHLPSGHLVAGPRIWIWNDGKHIHLEWDNRLRLMNGVLAWTALLGSWEMPVQEFLEEVKSFDASLMEAMQIRVEQIMAGWSRPGVSIDKDSLLLEQADRSTWLRQALVSADKEQPFDWSPILGAVARIDAETKA